MQPRYGGADISHDASRVAYLTATELRVLNVSTGATTVLDSHLRGLQVPRWSAAGDRIAYLTPAPSNAAADGAPVVINADGTGRRELGSGLMSHGFAWSPDGVYLIGRAGGSFSLQALRLVRVSDGAMMLLRFPTPDTSAEEYFQPDWR
jgi:hypothetical protein